MGHQLTVWGRRNAFNVRKVLRLVEELALTHRHVDAGGPFGGLDTPELPTLHPNGRVPVLQDGGTVVWESHSIIRYLAARYAAGSFWPEDPGERSHADHPIWPATASKADGHREHVKVPFEDRRAACPFSHHSFPAIAKRGNP